MRFYTIVPEGIEWPWHFYTYYRMEGIYRRRYKHAILDPGVGLLFHHRKLKEYPKHFIENYANLAVGLTKLLKDRIWISIPDYPDDYLNNPLEDNVERTLENMKAVMKYPANWLPIIQSDYLSVDSFRECAKVVREETDVDRVAIGTVCKTRNLKFIVSCCRIARRVFPDRHIHAFGLTLNALPKVRHLIDSFDSLAWTFPRRSGHSYKTKAEQRRYFWEYVNLYRQYIDPKRYQTKLGI